MPSSGWSASAESISHRGRLLTGPIVMPWVWVWINATVASNDQLGWARSAMEQGVTTKPGDEATGL